MTYRVVYSPRSERDLEKIGVWIVGESASTATAVRFLGQILDACETLDTLPQRFAVYPFELENDALWKLPRLLSDL